MNITKKTVKISDFYFAAFLKTAGFELMDVLKENNKKLFVFRAETTTLNKIQTEFVNGVSKVVAKDLIDNLRNLKTLASIG